MRKYYIKKFKGSTNLDEYSGETLYNSRNEAFVEARKLVLEMIENDLDFDDFDGDMSNSAFEYSLSSSPYGFEYRSTKDKNMEDFVSVAIREYELEIEIPIDAHAEDFFKDIADGKEVITRYGIDLDDRKLNTVLFVCYGCPVIAGWKKGKNEIHMRLIDHKDVNGLHLLRNSVFNAVASSGVAPEGSYELIDTEDTDGLGMTFKIMKNG